MTFPTIPTVAAGRVLSVNQADTNATRTFPNLSSLTKNSGDLLIAIVVAYQSTATANNVWSAWGGSFTEFGDFSSTTTMAIGCAYKRSTGSETGTFTVTQGAAVTGHATMFLLSIPGVHASTNPEAGGYASGTNAAINPGSLDPTGWATEDTLWVAVAGLGETSTAGAWDQITATNPTNYSNIAVQTTTADAVGAVAAAVAFRQVAAASEDPGTFTNDASNSRWAGITVAVRPPPAPASGSASGALGWSGSATGVRHPAGSASGTITDAGSATGRQPPPQGSASGAINWGNLVVPEDASFEGGTVGHWVGGGGTGTIPTLANDATHAYSGTKALKITWGTATLFPQVQLAGANIGPFVVGDLYVLTTRVWVPSGSPDVAVTLGANAGSIVTAKNGWAVVRATKTATAAVHGVALFAQQVSPGMEMWLDEIRVDRFAEGQAQGSSPHKGEASGTVGWAGSATGARTSTGSAVGETLWRGYRKNWCANPSFTSDLTGWSLAESDSATLGRYALFGDWAGEVAYTSENGSAVQYEVAVSPGEHVAALATAAVSNNATVRLGVRFFADQVPLVGSSYSDTPVLGGTGLTLLTPHVGLAPGTATRAVVYVYAGAQATPFGLLLDEVLIEKAAATALPYIEGEWFGVTGAHPHYGAGTGALLWSGFASGIRPATAPHSGEGIGSQFTFTGAAAGVRHPAGSASGATDWAGSATGTATRTGSASGDLAWVGSATGEMPTAPPNEGSASGAVGWAGSSTGQATHNGSASGAVGWAGSATGARDSTGSGTGAVDWVGSATGESTRTGAATGAVDWAGSATGEAPSVGVNEGSATGSISWVGASSGARGSAGDAAGDVAWVGNATGKRESTGAATGAVGWAGSSIGVRYPQGSSTGAVTWAGSAAGETPANEGAAAGAVDWAGSATGVRGSDGAAVGTITWAGSATGQQPGTPLGHAVGAVVWAGTATGGVLLIEVGPTTPGLPLTALGGGASGTVPAGTTVDTMQALTARGTP